MRLKIDPEFRDKIPPLTDAEFEGLKSDILRDGYVRDPLVVWDEENTLLDGHNRWRVICENWDKLHGEYTVDRRSFPDRWACIAWICANQLHKRNITEIQRMKLLQEEHDARKKSIGAPTGNQNAKKQSGEIHQINSAKNPKANQIRAELADEHRVTESEVRTAVEVGRGIDRAAEVDPEFKREVLSGEVKARKGDLANIRKLDTEKEISEAIEAIRNPPPKQKQSNNPRGFTKADRELRESVNRIVSDMYDPSTVPEYTVEDLVIDIKNNAKEFVSVIKSILQERSTVLTDEARPLVAEAIKKELIDEFKKVRDILV